MYKKKSKVVKKDKGDLEGSPSSISDLKAKLGSMLQTTSQLSDLKKRKKYDVVSTGLIEVDIELRTGGWIRGRINEIFGPPHVGKSFWAMLACIWEAKFNGRKSLWGDIEEGAFDERWFTQLGGDMRYLEVFRPDPDKLKGEDAMDSFVDLVRLGNYSIAVVDSLQGTSFLPEAVLSKRISDENRIGIKAQKTNAFVDKLVVACLRTKTSGLLLNHERDVIGSRFHETYAPGGTYKNYLTDCRVRVGTNKEGSQFSGKIVRQKRAKVAGNKFETKAEFSSFPDNYKTLISLAIKEELIESHNQWLSFIPSKGADIKFKSKKEWIELVKEDKKIFTDIKDRLLDHMYEIDMEDVEEVLPPKNKKVVEELEEIG